jgi:two-component system chemotaxis response regulator CheY
MTLAMIVDDSKIIRKVTRRILESLGFSIVEAENGRLALDEFRQHRPKLILLDWHMPVMDGLEFIKHLRKEEGGQEPVVIFCTTETEFENIQAALESGANEYVMKPFDEEILRGKLVQLNLLAGDAW